MHNPLPRRAATALFGCSFLAVCALRAQQFSYDAVRPETRIRERVDDGRLARLHGNVHPLLRAATDLGAVAPDSPMERMILVLQRDAAQQKALDSLLAAQQDPHSPQYHRWLTPQAFGERFGVARNDIDAIVAWLHGRGFEVEEAPAGGQSIIFSGTAAAVASAFHTSIRTYRVNGELHHANESDPAIPAALAEV